MSKNNDRMSTKEYLSRYAGRILIETIVTCLAEPLIKDAYKLAKKGVIWAWHKITGTDEYRDHPTRQNNPSQPTPNSSEEAGIDVEETPAEVKARVIKEMGLNKGMGEELTSAEFADMALDYGFLENTGTEWLYDPIIPRGTIATLASKEGVGKSILAMQIALELTNVNLVGRTSKSEPQHDCACLYFDSELERYDIEQRYGNLICSSDTLSDLNIYLGCTKMSLYRWLDEILKKVMAVEGKDCFVVLDNLTSMISESLDNHEAPNHLIKGLKYIQREFSNKGHKMTVLMLTHTTKDSDGTINNLTMAGSADLGRFVYTKLFLAQEKGDADDIVTIVTDKQRSCPKASPFKMKRVGNPYLHFVPIGSNGKPLQSHSPSVPTYDCDSNVPSGSADNTPKAGRPKTVSDDLVREIHAEYNRYKAKYESQVNSPDAGADVSTSLPFTPTGYLNTICGAAKIGRSSYYARCKELGLDVENVDEEDGNEQ